MEIREVTLLLGNIEKITLNHKLPQIIVLKPLVFSSDSYFFLAEIIVSLHNLPIRDKATDAFSGE